jgi:TonB family protein
VTRRLQAKTLGGGLRHAAAAGGILTAAMLAGLSGPGAVQAASSASHPAPARIVAPAPPAVPDSRHYPANELDVRPGIKVRVNPAYPERAARENVSGKAVVGLFIDADGAVERIEIERETPGGYGFGESAASAFRAARFSPAMKGGKRVRALMRVEISFDAPAPKAKR